MKNIDWNKASELGLIERINRQILHPLGLAMTRNPETGASECLLVADDGIWEYADSMIKNTTTDDDIKSILTQIIETPNDN